LFFFFLSSSLLFLCSPLFFFLFVSLLFQVFTIIFFCNLPSSLSVSLSLFFPLFFFLFWFFFLPPFSSALSSPVFIGEKWGEKGLLPLSSHGTGVEWSGRPLGSHLRAACGACPLCFFFSW
jgi:hypothetical protein